MTRLPAVFIASRHLPAVAWQRLYLAKRPLGSRLGRFGLSRLLEFCAIGLATKVVDVVRQVWSQVVQALPGFGLM